MTSDRVAYSQSGRMMAVETKLGPDVLLLSHLVAATGTSILEA